MTPDNRVARKLLAAILALSVGVVALSVWAMSLLSTMVYWPSPPDECAVVGAYLLHGKWAVGSVSEGIPTDTVEGCADAAARLELPTEIVVWVAVGFDVFAVVAIVVLLIARHRLLKRIRVERAALTGEATPRQRVTRIGWIALGLSIAALALLFGTGWSFGEALGSAGTSHEPVSAVLFPYFGLGTMAGIVATIVVCILAGTRGRANRIVGVVGGVVLIAPVLWLLADSALQPILNP